MSADARFGGDKLRRIRAVVLFVLGAALGSPLIAQAWKAGEPARQARESMAEYRAQIAQIVRKIIRD